MSAENELLARIAQLEAENSELRDKLDMIYAIVAPPDEAISEDDEAAESGSGLVQIDGPS